MAYKTIKENIDALVKETDKLNGRNLVCDILAKIDNAHSDIKGDYFSALEKALNDNPLMKDAAKDMVEVYKKELMAEN